MENIQKQLARVMTADQVSEEKEKNIATVDFKMVTFSLSGKDYAIDIMSVKEIAKAGRFTYVPYEFFNGLADLHFADDPRCPACAFRT